MKNKKRATTTVHADAALLLKAKKVFANSLEEKLKSKATRELAVNAALELYIERNGI